jgi:NarL family two-component system sensor histidine kinase LiaS
LKNLHRFRSLQWKLASYYTLTTIAVLLLLEMFAGIAIFYFFMENTNQVFAKRVNQVAVNMGSNFTGPFINRKHLSEALKTWGKETGTEFRGYSAFIGVDNKMNVVEGPNTAINEEELRLPSIVQRHVRMVLNMSLSNALKRTTYTYENKGTVYIVAPIANQTNVKGALVVKAEQIRFYPFQIWESVPVIIGINLLIFFFGAGVVGIAFGIVTSRSFVRRIRGILSSIDQWSQGNFKNFVQDDSPDEMGLLVQRLNQMAKQLQHLLREQQNIATLEERNRLARELHDSVKQQMFALSIWVSTAKSLVEKNSIDAELHLVEAENLIRQTQRELSAMIQELRPAAMEGKDLATALSNYILVWQDQSGIGAQLEVIGKKQVLPLIEEAFFRIAQEALSNVARHSKATEVKVCLRLNDIVSLSIHDNGIGFDTQMSTDQQGIGLSSMRERLKALHGKMNIHSELLVGTTIMVQCNQIDIQTDREV